MLRSRCCLMSCNIAVVMGSFGWEDAVVDQRLMPVKIRSSTGGASSSGLFRPISVCRVMTPARYTLQVASVRRRGGHP